MLDYSYVAEESDRITGHLTLHSLALDIADRTARSEIELYSLHSRDATGRRVFDTKTAQEDLMGEECLSIVAKAMRYIELRGHALSYRMHRSGAMVWFEDLTAAPARTR